MTCSYLLRKTCLRGLLLVALALPSLAADQRLLALVPGDVEAVVGADVQSILKSALVEQLMRGASAEASMDIEKVIAMTGMDPRRDLHQVMIASFPAKAGSKDPVKNNGIALISGNFDAARIGAALTNDGGSKVDYKGKTLWKPTKRGNPDGDVLTFVDKNTMVAGSERQVKRFLDGGHGQLGAGLKSQVNDVSNRYDIWMVSAASPATLAGSLGGGENDLQQMAGPLQGDMLKKIESVQGGLKFGPQMLMGLEMNAASAEDATALMNVLQFFQSMLAGGAPSGEGGMPQGLQKMLNSVKMRTQAKTLLINMSMAEKDVVDFLQSAAKQSVSRPRSTPSDEPGADEEIRVAEPQQQQEEIIIIQ